MGGGKGGLSALERVVTSKSPVGSARGGGVSTWMHSLRNCVGALVTQYCCIRSCHCYINVFYTIVFYFQEWTVVNHLYKHYIYCSLQTMSRTRFLGVVDLIKPSLKKLFFQRQLT